MASSSSSSVQQKFQVFLSFRGEDTRNNFTSHLHGALKRKGIATFVDYRLEKGEKIETLFTVIEESTISIIVLSKNYASSSWCLDELSKILECKKTMGHKVVPIFYHVDPSDVRHIRGSFEEALEKQQQRFKDKVERWRAALKEVADLSGFHLPGHPNDRLESKVVEKIAQDISEKLMCNFSVDIKPLVGIDSRVKQIESLLCFDSKDVRIVGIWGMGGIGKTTIAEAVYNRFIAKFEGYCFLNVGTESNYQHKLFSQLLGDKNLNVDKNSLEASITDGLQRKKVLLVLDDVNDSKPLDLLSLKFGCGSRIIVTSRDKRLLEIARAVIYEVSGLSNGEALQLFSLCAFKQNHPKEEFVELSEKMVHYVKGVPLAIIVLGCSLYGKTLSSWEGDLNKLKEIPDPEIYKFFRISYDGLEGEVKDIFLDIACFFNLEHRDYVEDILDGCYMSATSGIELLIHKSLLTISNDNVMMMHNLLRQMALNIIRQESKEPGKRSRLWTPTDIYHVLRNNTGTESVKGMLLDMSEISRRVFISPTAFARMNKLKILKFYYSGLTREKKVFLENGLESLPNTLSSLYWDGYPSKSLPSNFCPENLVELSMPHSHLKQLWNGVKNLVKLKRLDLSYSQYLIKIPDLSEAINLERMTLDECTNLMEVPPSIRYLNKLSFLNLEGCKKLKIFPSIGHLRSLKDLILSDASNVTKFPENLESLCLRGTGIEDVPSSIELLPRLKWLDLTGSKRLERLPSSICKLKFLQNLSLEGCLKLESFPEIMETMECLKFLDLSRTSIEELHSSIKNLVGLIKLKLDYCEKLKSLPSSICKLKFLENLDLSGCKRLQSLPPELPPRLRFLDAHDCISLEEVSSAFPIRRHKAQEFMFTDCLKLDQNCIKKFVMSIQQKATKDVKLFHKKPYNRRSSLSICFPGSEIPEWFSCKSQGSQKSAVTIRSPPHLHDDKFVGFAMCVVLAVEPRINTSRSHGGIHVSCKYNFNSNGSNVSRIIDSLFLMGRISDFDHVILGYDSKFYRDWYEEESKRHIIEASFEFSVHNLISNDLSDYYVVKECGVCLPYAQDDNDCVEIENESESESKSEGGD